MENVKPDLTRLRRDALSIFHSALDAVDPEEAVRRHLRIEGSMLAVEGRRYDLNACKRILVAGAGKAVAPMAKALEDLLGGRIAGGYVAQRLETALSAGER